MKRSIHGMGQMMSTMVLNRKQSIFGGPGARGAGLGAGLDGQRGGKDSIDRMDLTVMDTKLKILEILQVSVFPEDGLYGVKGMGIEPATFCLVYNPENHNSN